MPRLTGQIIVIVLLSVVIVLQLALIIKAYSIDDDLDRRLGPVQAPASTFPMPPDTFGPTP